MSQAATLPTETSTGPTPKAVPRYPLGWLRGLAAIVVVTFHAYQHNRTGPESRWPLDGAPEGARAEGILL